MNTTVPPVPAGLNTVVPYLTVSDSAAALAFYASAFGAEERAGRLTSPDGTIMHAMVDVFGTTIMLADAMPEMGAVGPDALGGTPVKFTVYVEDAQAVVDAAVQAGGELTAPVETQFFGHRSGRIKDPFGHQWIISTQTEVIDDEEMGRRFDALFS